MRVQYGGDKRPDQTQAYEHWPPRKIDVTRKLTVVSISVVTLIRTDTTIDHSQKAEKVWASRGVTRSRGFFVGHLAVCSEGGEKDVKNEGAPMGDVVS